MAFLHFHGTMKIRKYSATGTARKSVVRVEIEVSDSYDLAALMRDIEEAQAELAGAKKARPKKSEPALEEEY